MEKEGSVWALCPVSCFINSRLIFHTCAVLGDISSYTRQARVHRFLNSFSKRETEDRNRKETERVFKSLHAYAIYYHELKKRACCQIITVMNIHNTGLIKVFVQLEPFNIFIYAYNYTKVSSHLPSSTRNYENPATS